MMTAMAEEVRVSVIPAVTMTPVVVVMPGTSGAMVRANVAAVVTGPVGGPGDELARTVATPGAAAGNLRALLSKTGGSD